MWAEPDRDGFNRARKTLAAHRYPAADQSIELLYREMVETQNRVRLKDAQVIG